MKSNQLNYLTTILRFREVLGGLDILRALYTQSENEWERCKGADTGEHLIKGVHHSMVKTDAVRTYVSKLAKLYLDSWGAQPSCWTKQTLMSEDTITKGVIDRITNMDLQSNDQLFTLVATRVLGIDLALVTAVVAADDYLSVSKSLVNYLGWMDDEIDLPSVVYLEMAILISVLMKHNLLTDALFGTLATNAAEYFFTNPNCDLDSIDLLDCQLDELVRRGEEYKEAHAEAYAKIQADAGRYE